ncbi:MAG: PilN domain-containing protein [Phycisphaerae bacterium]|nr:PilN domain-containing protein [Phycisphaerae bacterium]
MSNTSFLPEDYIAQAAERRTNLASLVLFGVVMTAVFGAFLVTNRQWTQVRQDQVRIHADTEQAAAEIRKMQELETKRAAMVDKAELAMTLIEPVPRSVLLALIVNAMPERLSLLDFDLKSSEVKRPKKQVEKELSEAKSKGASAPKVSKRGQTKGQAAAAAPLAEKEAPKPEPVRHVIAITMTGIAQNDLDVSRYMNGLSGIPIFKAVRLETTEEKEVDGLYVRYFKISMRIDADADIRSLRNSVLRPGNPLMDTVEMSPPSLRSDVGEMSESDEPMMTPDDGATPQEPSQEGQP